MNTTYICSCDNRSRSNERFFFQREDFESGDPKEKLLLVFKEVVSSVALIPDVFLTAIHVCQDVIDVFPLFYTVSVIPREAFPLKTKDMARFD